MPIWIYGIVKHLQISEINSVLDLSLQSCSFQINNKAISRYAIRKYNHYLLFQVTGNLISKHGCY